MPVAQDASRQHAMSEVGDPTFLSLLRRTLADDDSWDVTEDGVWCRVVPRPAHSATQGWKLHLSTTLPQASTVLERTLPELLDARCPFKFARCPAEVYTLNSGHAPRSGAGKFLTVYPGDDATAVELAAALHESTSDLAGPVILSDRPYCPGSLVHYRYGTFASQRVLSNDGLYRDMLRTPSGEAVIDRREARYSPPSWAVSPFGEPERRPANPGGVLLNGRFAVREALRHANKGGVYRATDAHTGTELIIKEARPHVAVSPTGTDARDGLRAEARALGVLAPLGLTPGVIDVFEQGGHVFLAEELVHGTTLRQWVLDRVRGQGADNHRPAALRLARQLASTLRAVHETGLVLRDFNPNNIMVLDDGDLRLLDLEWAAPAGQQGESVAGGTTGYAAPEQLRGATPAVPADSYSLGATLLFTFTAADPCLPPDDPEHRTLRARLAEWLSSVSATPIPEHVRPLALNLLDEEPSHRPTAAHAELALTSYAGSRADEAAEPAELGRENWQEAVDGIVGHLLESMNPQDPERLWPVDRPGPVHDPCTVQHGAAGVLGALTRHYELRGGTQVAEAIATAIGWIERRMARDAFRPPGLYFGQSGIAWALHDAAHAIGDDAAAGRAVRLAKSLPAEWPNPDLTHGTAGLGLTALHFWQVTGDDEFRHRAGKSAAALIASAHRERTGFSWRTPDSFESLFAGQSYLGFAHGNAGIGYFLLAAATLGIDECLAPAEQAAELLLTEAVNDTGGARWRPGPDTSEPLMPYWCSGSSGVGTFLLRWSAFTADERARSLAERAAKAARDHAWPGPVGQCHGLAGNAEFLLDMAAFLDDPRYARLAGQVARAVFARRCYRDGRVVFVDGENTVSAEWADGLSGVLAFLLRLRHDGSRLWMVDPRPRWEAR